MLGRRFTLPGFRVDHDVVTLSELRDRLGCDVVATPTTVAVIGWDDTTGRWLLCPARSTPPQYRLPATLRFFEHRVRPLLPAGSFWFLCCMSDGWGEPPKLDALTDLPLVSPTRTSVLCYAARRDDPSAVLIPESHYLERFHYARFRLEARLRRQEWDDKQPTAIFCGSAHGRLVSTGAQDRVAREVLREVVEREDLPVRVHLGGGVSRGKQSECRYLLDVDGFVRTYDAWAWKLFSGSVVLSQASPWETFFTAQFEPWVHFIPVREDFADLGERLSWCRGNDDECRAIALRGQARAATVYAIDEVTARAAAEIGEALGASP